MRTATLNVKGARDLAELQRILAYLRDNRVDLALLCESRLDNELLFRIKQRWSSYGWYTDSPYTDRCGVIFVVLSPDRIPLEICTVYHQGLDGRSIALRCRIEGSSTYSFLGVYAPNSETENVSFFRAIAANPLIGNPSIIMGDINQVLISPG